MPEEFISQEPPEDGLMLTPWIVQNIIYEIIANHMVMNDPAKMGYTFKQRYNREKQLSEIQLGISYNWEKDTTTKRPAIFVNRGDAKITNPTIKQALGGSNVKDSEHNKISYIEMPVSVFIVAQPVGFVEQLADYIKYPFMYFAQQIQRDFCLQRFRLTQIGKPQLVVDQKDDFVIELGIDVNFTDRWIVKGDFLKLKTVSYAMLDKLTHNILN